MHKERLQILIEPEQRQRLEMEAKRRGASVAALIREAIDARFGAVRREDRLQGLEEIRRLRGSFLPPAELDRLVDQEREEQIEIFNPSIH